MTTEQAAPRREPDRAEDVRGLFVVLVFASLVTTVVSTLGAPLVPVLAAEQGVPLATGQWALTITLIVGAVATPVLGRLADGPHRRAWLLGVLTTVAVGCAISAVSSSFAVMLGGRALQGVGYGVMPICLAIARDLSPPSLISSRIAALSITGATGVGLGYALVGGITELFGYRAAFGFGTVVSIVATAAVAATIPKRPRHTVADGHGLDMPGAVMLVTGVSALLLGIGQGQHWGWSSTPVAGLLLFAAVLLAAWVRHELRVPRPLVNLRLMRHRSVLLANATAFLLGVTMFMGFAVITRLAQAPQPAGLGASVFVAGLLLAPLALGSQASHRLARAAARRAGMAFVLPFGVAITVLPNLVLAIAHDHAWQLAAAMLLFGAGVGSTFAAMPVLIVEGVPHDETGSATSFNQLLRSIGGSTGSALSAVVLTAYTTTGDAFPRGEGYTMAFALSAIGCLAVFVALVAARPGRRPVPAAAAAQDPTPPVI